MVSLTKRVFPPFIPMYLQIQCDILLSSPAEDTCASTAMQDNPRKLGGDLAEHQAASLTELEHSWEDSLLSLSLNSKKGNSSWSTANVS